MMKYWSKRVYFLLAFLFDHEQKPKKWNLDCLQCCSSYSHFYQDRDTLTSDVSKDESSVPASRSVKKPSKKKRDGSTLRKAPQAPKRFKSSYICFFMAKQQEIKESLTNDTTVSLSVIFGLT
jgi:hypothetical protein